MEIALTRSSVRKPQCLGCELAVTKSPYHISLASHLPVISIPFLSFPKPAFCEAWPSFSTLASPSKTTGAILTWVSQSHPRVAWGGSLWFAHWQSRNTCVTSRVGLLRMASGQELGVTFPRHTAFYTLLVRRSLASVMRFSPTDILFVKVFKNKTPTLIRPKID